MLLVSTQLELKGCVLSTVLALKSWLIFIWKFLFGNLSKKSTNGKIMRHVLEMAVSS
jgi:hypothetical protein